MLPITYECMVDNPGRKYAEFEIEKWHFFKKHEVLTEKMHYIFPVHVVVILKSLLCIHSRGCQTKIKSIRFFCLMDHNISIMACKKWIFTRRSSLIHLSLLITKHILSFALPSMSVECTNRILISARSAQLGQPAPKFKLDLYIPWIS